MSQGRRGIEDCRPDHFPSVNSNAISVTAPAPLKFGQCWNRNSSAPMLAPVWAVMLAAALGGTAWSAPAGGARSGPGRHRAPARAVSRWLPRWAPEVVSPHGLKPCSRLDRSDDCLRMCAHRLRASFGWLCAGPTGTFEATKTGQRVSSGSVVRVRRLEKPPFEPSQDWTTDS